MDRPAPKQPTQLNRHESVHGFCRICGVPWPCYTVKLSLAKDRAHPATQDPKQ